MDLSCALRPEVFQTRVYFRRRGRRGAVPRVFGQPETSAQGHPLLPSRSNSLSVLRESYAWGPLPLIENPRLGVPQIWVEAASSEPHPRIALGPRVRGTAWVVRRHQAFWGQRPKTLAQGGFTPPGACPIGRRSPKRRTSKWMSFFRSEDEARTAFQGPRKAPCLLGPPSWIEKSAATPRIWVEAASSSPTHVSPGTRVSWTAWVRRHKRFGGNAPKPGAGGFIPPEQVQVRSPKRDVLPDVLSLERVTRLKASAPQEAMLSWGPLPLDWKIPRLPRIWVEVTSSSPTTHRQGPRQRDGVARRHKRFGATPQNSGAGRSFRPSMPNSRRSPKEGRPTDVLFGASDEARTRYLHLGKVALYQMSYTASARYIITLPWECQGDLLKSPKILRNGGGPSPQVRRISATRCWPLSG